MEADPTFSIDLYAGPLADGACLPEILTGPVSLLILGIGADNALWRKVIFTRCDYALMTESACTRDMAIRWTSGDAGLSWWTQG